MHTFIEACSKVYARLYTLEVPVVHCLSCIGIVLPDSELPFAAMECE